jgi:O-antigen/teichoic acid export membrane protein
LPNKNDSKKQILKSSSIIGGASFITILIGLLKFKFLAVLLGPEGIGLMGLLTTIMATGATFFGMGLGVSGVRELVLNNENIEKSDLVRKALLSANFLLGLLALFIICIFRSELSEWFFQSADQQNVICVIAVGVFFSLLLTSQTTVLQGFRKITELAKVKVIGALASTLIGLVIIWQFGKFGLPFFIVTVPLVTCFVAFYYSRKLPRLTNLTFSFKQLKPQWQRMFSLGFALMLTSLMVVGSQLMVRYILIQELGIELVGYFQAAWTISMTYITFVLGAMAADYYPRLTQQIHRQDESNRLVNEQTEIAIIFAAPVLLAMLSFAPLIIHLLYSSEFTDSVEILRWQVFGDILKIISWPLGFIILAKGYSKLFFCVELLWCASYVLLVFFGIHALGIEITGYAFAVAYLIYLSVVYFVTRKINSFQWTKNNIKLILLLILMGSVLLLLSYFSLIATMILGFILVVFSTFYAVKTIAELGIKNHKLEKILTIYKKLIFLLGFKS